MLRASFTRPLLPGRRLPVILQAESSECALACLAMIAAYHSGASDFAGLRHRYGAGLRGWSLRRLLDVATQIGLTPRALRIEHAELAQLRCPAVLHWNFDHFVVLKKVHRRAITVHNPALGERRIPFAEVARHLTGIAVEFIPCAAFAPGPGPPRLHLWDFWRGTTGAGRSVLQLLLLSALIQLFALAAPSYMQVVVDDVLVKGDIDLLLLLACGFALLAMMQVATKALRGYAGVYLANQLGLAIGTRLVFHLLRLPLEYFRKRHIGDVVSRVRSLQPVQDFLTGGVIAAAIDGAMAVTTLIVLFVYSPLLAGIVLGAFASYAVFRAAMFASLRHRTHESIAANARLDSNFMETIRALQSIKLYGRELERGQHWQDLFVDSINASARTARLNVAYDAISGVLLGVETVLLVFVGAQQVVTGALSIGMLYAVIAYRAHFSAAMNSLINQGIQYLMLRLHLERIADIALTEIEPGLASESAFLAPVRGALQLEHLTFAWPHEVSPVIDDLSIEIAAGQSLAIVGPSGVGKSTLLRIMLGLIQPTAGRVRSDGIALTTLGMRSFRAGTAAVLQDDVLLTGSIRDNISLFDMHCDQERLTRASQLAQLYDAVMQLPMRFDTPIGDMGSTLSAGQQQRVLLARALYRDPAILFLDEGTGHLDAASESALMQTVLGLQATCIFTTHRADIAALADRILALNQDGWQISTTPRGPGATSC